MCKRMRRSFIRWREKTIYSMTRQVAYLLELPGADGRDAVAPGAAVARDRVIIISG